MARTQGARDKQPRKNARQNGAEPAGQPGPGHNTMSEQARQAAFIRHVQEIEEAKAAVDDAFAAADAAGFTKKDINYALKLRKGDDEQLVQRRRRENEIARWLNHPVGTQSDLFEDVSSTLNTHHENGRVAGMEGRPCKPPDTLGAGDREQWIEGWHAGNAARNEAIQKQMQQSQPEGRQGGGSELADESLESKQSAPAGAG